MLPSVNVQSDQTWNFISWIHLQVPNWVRVVTGSISERSNQVGYLFPIQEQVVGSLSPSLSLGLFEIVVMGRNDDGYQVDFDTQSWVEDTVIGYKVKPD